MYFLPEVEIILSFLIRLFCAFLTLAVILWILRYFGLPFIMYKFVAPRFNAAYTYRRKDFEKDGLSPVKPGYGPSEGIIIGVEPAGGVDVDGIEKRIVQIMTDNGRKFIIGIPYFNHGGKRITPSSVKLGITELPAGGAENSAEDIVDIPLKGVHSPTYRNGRKIVAEYCFDYEETGEVARNREAVLIGEYYVLSDVELKVYEPDIGIFATEDFKERYRSGGFPDETSFEGRTVTIKYPGLVLCRFSVKENIEIIPPGDYRDFSFVFSEIEVYGYYNRKLTFRNTIFSPPDYRDITTTAPVLMYDDTLTTVAISPLDNFQNGAVRGIIGSPSRLVCGLNGEVNTIKNYSGNYAGGFILITGRGINSTLEKIGDLLRAYHGTERKSMYGCIPLSYIGYWTDNGAYYYYRPVKGLTMAETLIKVKEYADSIGVCFPYYNIDSYWYLKEVAAWKRKLLGGFGRLIGGGLYGGTVRWEADPEVMNIPPDELSRKLSAVFVAHNRWFSSETPYKERFRFYTEGGRAFSFDPAFWDFIMENCRKWNIDTYEQDWMFNQFKSFGILRSDPEICEKWLGNMARAAEKFGRNIQYCMAAPGMFMASVKYPAVKFARAGGDYNPTWPKIYNFRFFSQTSMLAYSLRLWPFADVHRTSTYGRPGAELRPEFMTLISVLSCGPVGVGDKIGHISVDNIKRACRSDGLIIKPDRSLTVIDRMFLPHKKYYACMTYSQKAGLRWYYLVLYKFGLRTPPDRTFTYNDLGITSDHPYLAYDYFGGGVSEFDREKPLRVAPRRFLYYILAPLTGPAVLIGDITKYCTLGYKLIPFVVQTSERTVFRVCGIAGDSSEILLYIPGNHEEIRITVEGKRISPVADVKTNGDPGKERIPSLHENDYKITPKITGKFLILKTEFRAERTLDFGIEKI